MILQRFSITTKIVLGLFAVSMSAIALVAWQSYVINTNSLINSSSNALKGIRAMKQRQIESYFSLIKNEALTFARDPLIVDAMNKLRSAFGQVQKDLAVTPEQMAQYKEKLKDYYEHVFIKKLNASLVQPEQAEDYLPTSDNAIILQNFYIVDNPYPIGSKENLDAHEDSSSYSAIHKYYHPVIRDYLKKFDYYDIFLIDPDTLNVVYTVFKEVDFANNLGERALEKSNLAELIRKIRTTAAKESYHIIDFAPYGPSFAAPAAFSATPIFDSNDSLVGVLAFQLPIHAIENIMTDDNKWESVGLGKTGESFLVAKDYKLRSSIRLFLEHPEEYFKTLEALGTPVRTIDHIRQYGTPILSQEITTESVKRFIQGETGILQEKNYRNLEALSAYAPLVIENLSWGIISTIDKAEVVAPMNNLRKIFIWFLALLALVLVLAALGMAWLVQEPLRELLKAIINHDTAYLQNIQSTDIVGKIAHNAAQLIEKLKRCEVAEKNMVATFTDMQKKFTNVSYHDIQVTLEPMLSKYEKVSVQLAHLQTLQNDLKRMFENTHDMLTKLTVSHMVTQKTINEITHNIADYTELARTLQMIQTDMAHAAQEGISATSLEDFSKCVLRLMALIDGIRDLAIILKNTVNEEAITTTSVQTIYQQSNHMREQAHTELELITKNYDEQYAMMQELSEQIRRIEEILNALQKEMKETVEK